MTGFDVVCLSSIDWDFLWQGHQEIMATLARDGNRVLFVENTGVRAANIRDTPRLAKRFQNWRRGARGLREERRNLFVYSPVLLPFPYSGLSLRINHSLLAAVLRQWLGPRTSTQLILWTFLPTPLARQTIKDLDPRLTIYYCIDALASSSPSAQRLEQSEEKLFREADLVFVTSGRLRDRASRFSNRVHLFPFGVDFEKFEQARESSTPCPPDLEGIPRPRVGYVGGVHRWVDQELLAQTADRLPGASFVLVGPHQTDLSLLARRSNVHLLGFRPHDDIPRYIKGFDVGIVPYRRCDYTDHVYPTKLNEYLAMGIPVVATGIPEVRRFASEHPGLVRVADDARAFAAALTEATGTNPPGGAPRRVDVARRNSWSRRIATMYTVIDQALAVGGLSREGRVEPSRSLSETGSP